MENGHVSKETKKTSVVLNSHCEGEFYNEASICLDHLNRMNSIPLTLNIQTAELIDNEWSDIGRRRPGETHEKYQARQEAFEKYDIASKDVMYALIGIRSTFWLTHKYDRRGRTYCQGYHVNYQGTAGTRLSLNLQTRKKSHAEPEEKQYCTCSVDGQMELKSHWIEREAH